MAERVGLSIRQFRWGIPRLYGVRKVEAARMRGARRYARTATVLKHAVASIHAHRSGGHVATINRYRRYARYGAFDMGRRQRARSPYGAALRCSEPGRQDQTPPGGQASSLCREAVQEGTASHITIGSKNQRWEQRHTECQAAGTVMPVKCPMMATKRGRNGQATSETRPENRWIQARNACATIGHP